MSDAIQDLESFLKIFPGPFKVSEMQTGPVGGPYESDFMVQCRKSCKVLQAHATKAEADAQADALNAIPVLLERLKTAEAVADLVPKAIRYLYSCEEKYEKDQLGMVKNSCNPEQVDLLVALRTYTKAKSR